MAQTLEYASPTSRTGTRGYSLKRKLHLYTINNQNFLLEPSYIFPVSVNVYNTTTQQYLSKMSHLLKTSKWPHSSTPAPSNAASPTPNPRGSHEIPTPEEESLSCKINRALASGPISITKNATIADWSHWGPDRTIITLREGTNHWTAFPGNENIIGNVPMCCDPNGLQWIRDAYAGKPAPTNTAPGLIYMLCGANQHTTTDPADRSSPAIPIGPHYMILWPFEAERDGFPDTVRDQGAWVMFDKTPYAHLHVCGTPWAGREFRREGTRAEWELKYVDRT